MPVGVGVAVAVADTEAEEDFDRRLECVAETEAEEDWLAVTLGDPEREGYAVPQALTDTEVELVGEGRAVGDFDGAGEPERDGCAVGEAIGVAEVAAEGVGSLDSVAGLDALAEDVTEGWGLAVFDFCAEGVADLEEDVDSEGRGDGVGLG